MLTDPAAEIEAGLRALGERFRQAFARATTEHELRQANAAVLGKKGELTALLKLLGRVPEDARRELGQKVNLARREVEQAFELRLAELRRKEREADLGAPPFDLSLPGRPAAPRGHIHPVTRVMWDIFDVFRSLGFELAWGPEVELEANNFTRLAFPPDHPALDMQDSFWVKVLGGKTGATLLRTQTSTVQVREMSAHPPPLAVVSGGPVYRRDDDLTHSPMFHQIEGFLVDQGVAFTWLKGVLTEFVRRLYGASTELRFRPSYFPFVEPGAEVDIGCVFCARARGSDCRVCKGTGWLEILGCGMVHPLVLKHTGIDPERYSGFAFGLGVERVAMLRYGIPDIRLFYENDPRLLAQF